MLSPALHTGIKIPLTVAMWGESHLPAPPYWICHRPHTTSKQMNQNIDTLTQQDSEMVSHQNSSQKNMSIAKHCSILVGLDILEKPGSQRQDYREWGRFRVSGIFRAKGSPLVQG